MFRALWYLAILAVLAFIAVWLADQPGTVTLEWRGWRLDTSASLLVVLVALAAVIIAIILQLISFIRRAPETLSRIRHERRRHQGYLALTRGMVAVAAGDVDGATRQAKRADVLLEDPALTMLLSAQAAQLNGDEAAASVHFHKMLDRPETEFLGVRGLLVQALKRGDKDAARGLAERAFRLRPKSDWVAENLFSLQTQAGLWGGAEETLGVAVRRGRMTAEDGRRRRAVLEHQRGIEAAGLNDTDAALKHARMAHKLDVTLAPASVRLARLLTGAGKLGKAARVLETAWTAAPHPDLVEPYYAARDAKAPLDRVKAASRLAKHNPQHDESRIVVAGAALEAKLWGEARKHLEPIATTGTSRRVCLLMAKIEESERGDLQQAHAWMARAAQMEPDPAWVCRQCGNVATDWTVYCGNCHEFDAFAWGRPPHVQALSSFGNETLTALPAMDEPGG
ncbi:MAG: heme biosynthesis protein HemY [Rhodospirillales bacterium]|nr:heme biosynthesis protein HemY [Rhodospirillales bacterium]